MRASTPQHPLVLAIGPGGRPGPYLQVRTQLDAAQTLSQALRTDGIETSFAVQESVMVSELTALVVSIGTGLGGVAAVVSAYLRRNQDRSFLMERDGTKHEIKGMSARETERLVDRLVQQAAEDQLSTEHLYRGLPNPEGGPTTSDGA